MGKYNAKSKILLHYGKNHLQIFTVCKNYLITRQKVCLPANMISLTNPKKGPGTHIITKKTVFYYVANINVPLQVISATTKNQHIW